MGIDLLERPNIKNLKDLKESTEYSKDEIFKNLSLIKKNKTPTKTKEEREIKEEWEKQIKKFLNTLNEFINLDPQTQIYLGYQEEGWSEDLDIIWWAELLDTFLDISLPTREYLEEKSITNLKQRLQNIYSDSNIEMSNKDHEKKIKMIFNGIKNEMIEKIPNLEEKTLPAA
jgi:hypothetical protein